MDLLEAVVVKLVVGPEGGQGAHAHAVGKEYLERESGHNSIQVGTLLFSLAIQLYV